MADCSTDCAAVAAREADFPEESELDGGVDGVLQDHDLISGSHAKAVALWQAEVDDKQRVEMCTAVRKEVRSRSSSS